MKSFLVFWRKIKRNPSISQKIEQEIEQRIQILERYWFVGEEDLRGS